MKPLRYMEDGVVNYISESLKYQKKKVEGELIKMAENVKFFNLGLFNNKICTLDGQTQRFIMQKTGKK